EFRRVLFRSARRPRRTGGSGEEGEPVAEQIEGGRGALPWCDPGDPPVRQPAADDRCADRIAVRSVTRVHVPDLELEMVEVRPLFRYGVSDPVAHGGGDRRVVALQFGRELRTGRPDARARHLERVGDAELT